MKPTLILSALLSCFVLSGNAQESAAVPSTGSVYATQGNAAQNRSVYELELQRSAQEARRMKELKAAIASQGFAPPPPITSASQFLAANRPPMPPPSEQPEEAERPDAYVPDFDTGPSSQPSNPSPPTASTPSFEMPEKDRSFFKWLKGNKKEESSVNLPPAGSSDYEIANPYEAPNTSSAPPAPQGSEGIPDVPAMNEEPAPIMRNSTPPAAQGGSGEPAPIFVRREQPAAATGETATVEQDTDAIVKGVLVKLFAGTQVSVLEKSGGNAIVRLPDGRVGTVKRKALR